MSRSAAAPVLSCPAALVRSSLARTGGRRRTAHQRVQRTEAGWKWVGADSQGCHWHPGASRSLRSLGRPAHGRSTERTHAHPAARYGHATLPDVPPTRPQQIVKGGMPKALGGHVWVLARCSLNSFGRPAHRTSTEHTHAHPAARYGHANRPRQIGGRSSFQFLGS